MDRASAIARRLERLMAREAARSGGRPPAYRELADRINRLAGRDVISRDTIRNLHLGLNQKGQASNPTVETLDWLGRGFGISAGASYFLDDAVAGVVDEQLDQLEKIGGLRQALGKDEVVSLVQRASALSDGSLRVLLTLADNLRKLEQDAAGRKAGPADRT
jgi:transcriptional regulator with XRE-family HTH domain